MDYTLLNFDELIGVFVGFIVFIYLIIVVLQGFMGLFDRITGIVIKRVFHYHYHYKDRRK